MLRSGQSEDRSNHTSKENILPVSKVDVTGEGQVVYLAPQLNWATVWKEI